MTAVNGVDLMVEEAGNGDPLVLVHGSWTDHFEWGMVRPALAERCRVIMYDRRGHTGSAPATGTIDDDVADLAALIEDVAGGSAYVYGNSRGGTIALRLAASRPGLVRSVSVHEPPAFAVLSPEAASDARPSTLPDVLALIAEGRNEEAARTFVETVAFGPGGWETLPAEARRTFTTNAPTFLEEEQDPTCEWIDVPALAASRTHVHLSVGDSSPPFFRAVVDHIAGAVPGATLDVLSGPGHVPQVTHPDLFVASVNNWLDGAQPD